MNYFMRVRGYRHGKSLKMQSLNDFLHLISKDEKAQNAYMKNKAKKQKKNELIKTYERSCISSLFFFISKIIFTFTKRRNQTYHLRHKIS